MAITTTYKCDCCGYEKSESEQMWHIYIGLQHYGMQSSIRDKEQLWCRPCVEKHDLLRGVSNPKEQNPPIISPTLEEIIREIIREEIHSVTGAC